MTDGVTVEVAVRVRPLVESEEARGCQQCLVTNELENQIVLRGNRCFTYNYVSGCDDTQTNFYESAVKKLVSRLFHGYNVTILAYGQTGSGKTYSMGTCYSGEEDAGIIPRAIKDIFKTISDKKEWDYSVTVSFMELYKEQLFDLLSENRNSVDIREENKEIRLSNLTEVAVKNANDTTRCLMQGSSGRATGATAMNAQSSRSHAIFTITIHQQKINDPNSSMSAKFHLVDLAGSERSKKTQATGERFKEGVDINKGLLALGNVISALGDEGQKGYISYRDSKLTRLLQDSLGGNSITLMIACVSPADYNLDETLSTLRYADRARRIKNKPIVNQDPKMAEIIALKQKIRELQLEVVNGVGNGTCPPEHRRLAEDNCALVAKNRSLTDALNDALSDSTYLVERALMAELARDRMKVKLCELQAEYGQTMEHLNQTIDQTTCPVTFLEQVQSLRNLQVKIQDLQEDQKKIADDILNHELTNSSIKKDEEEVFVNVEHMVDIDQRHERHAQEQQGLTKELQELNRALALKEELASRMAANSKHMQSIRPNYESNMKEMEEQIANLQQEKDRLTNDLKNMQSSNINNANSNKLAEQRRVRLQELETKIAALTKKITEQAKVIKMNEQADKKILKLHSEIQSMKQTKVSLIREMRSSNETFRDWKKKRLQEICKLKDQDRRRQCEMVRMERLHTKQQNVLKRKWEEAASTNKRLKDALAVQKMAKERRLNNASTVNKVQTWLGQEVEVAVSTVEAQRTLDHLLDDRATMHTELAKVITTLKSEGLTAEELSDLEKEKARYEEEIEFRNMQIDDFQQKIMDSDQENKGKSRFDTVQSLVEAKCAMKYLFDIVTDSKRELCNKNYKLEELEDAHKQATLKLNQFEQQLKSTEKLYKEKLLRTEKAHQDKVFVLLRQLNKVEDLPSEDGDHLTEKDQIFQHEFAKLDSMKDELEKRDEEIKLLKAKLNSTFNDTKSSLYAVGVELPKAVKTKKQRPVVPMHELENSPIGLTDTEDEDDDPDKDPDWHKTPIFKRIQKMKVLQNVNTTITLPVKRNSDGQTKCSCKGKCHSRVCSCRKNSAVCSEGCKCDSTVCQNQSSGDAKRTLFNGSVSNSSEENYPEESFKKPRLLSDSLMVPLLSRSKFFLPNE